MIYSVFAVRDFKTGFLTPTVDVNREAAVRNFEHAVLNSEDSLFFSHPEDYALFEIGQYDTDTGRLMPLDVVTEIRTAVECFGSSWSERLAKYKEAVADV